jgi:hypothetical protein
VFRRNIGLWVSRPLAAQDSKSSSLAKFHLPSLPLYSFPVGR